MLRQQAEPLVVFSALRLVAGDSSRCRLFLAARYPETVAHALVLYRFLHLHLKLMVMGCNQR